MLRFRVKPLLLLLALVALATVSCNHKEASNESNSTAGSAETRDANRVDANSHSEVIVGSRKGVVVEHSKDPNQGTSVIIGGSRGLVIEHGKDANAADANTRP